jgi:hypothetical protein
MRTRPYCRLWVAARAYGCGAVTETREGHSVGVVAARIGLVVGGSVCLAVTPQFSLAYHSAYGFREGETANAWIKQVEWPTWVSGLDAISTYKRYGVIFGFALAVVVISLAVVVRSRKGKGKWERRGWRVAVGGVGAVAIGSLSEYGISEDLFDASNGFGLELLGFLLIMIGTPILGSALRREAGVGRIKSVGVALIGPIGVIGGLVINGHLPSGPAMPIIVAVMVVGITGLPDTDHA